jgi:hypothetical protein
MNYLDLLEHIARFHLALERLSENDQQVALLLLELKFIERSADNRLTITEDGFRVIEMHSSAAKQ